MRQTLLALCLAAAASPVLAQDETKGRIDFVKEIQPILQNHCVKCHGAKKQEGELRLDLKKHVFHDEKDLWSIVPGDAEFSSVYERITLPADDPDVMPAEGEPLTKEQVAAIKTWIEQGAEWPESADQALLELEAKRKAREVITLPELSDAQRAAESKAMDVVREAGGLALRVAANTTAVEVNFSLLGDKVTDAHLDTLRGLEPTLVWLNLARTGVGDAGVGKLTDFAQIRRLNLANSAVTDAGLEALAGLEGLEYLNLYGTAVTDAGLRHLEGLGNLARLYLWQTQVTDEGAANLLKKLPDLQIDLGRAAEALLAPAEPKPAAINDKCPVSDKPVDLAHTSEIDGKLVAFCCGNCKAKFDADPAPFRAKLGLEVAQAKPINDTCPVSGKAIDSSKTSEVDGKLVAFCCGNCKAKFDADPAPFRKKLGLDGQ
jgi:YHS domain-containing protein/mono/diheme cytochrome c family protein